MAADPNGKTGQDSPSGYAAIDSDVDAWAAREHQRRQAWLSGPSEREKAAMKSRLLAREARLSDDASFDPGRVDDEVDFWAARESDRRKAWAEGPADGRDRGGFAPERWRDNLESAQDEMARAWTRTDYAARGLWRRIFSEAANFYDDLVEEGRRSSVPPRRRRIPY